MFNSSSIDELGRWCPEGWLGPDAIKGKAGRYPWQPSAREPPLYAATNRHRHTDGVSGTPYLNITYFRVT